MKDLIGISNILKIYKRVRKNALYTVQTLKKLDENGNIMHGPLDASIISKRKQREKMLRLGRVFHYETKNQLDEKFMKKKRIFW